MYGVLLAIGMALATVGCVTLKHPRGAWSRPVVVPLPNDKPLAGSTIGLECGESEPGAKRWRPGTFTACRDLAKLMQLMGAKVSAPAGLLPVAVQAASPEGVDGDEQKSDDSDKSVDDEPDDSGRLKRPVDFTVRYIDEDNDRDYCGWTLPLFILSFSFFPCIEDIHSQAELRLVDAQGSLAARYPLALDIRGIYGVAALYYQILELSGVPEPVAVRTSRDEKRLIRYVQSLLYTYKVRRSLEQAKAAEGAA